MMAEPPSGRRVNLSIIPAPVAPSGTARDKQAHQGTRDDAGRRLESHGQRRWISGLVNEAPAPEDFEAAVTAKAEKIASGAPIAQAMIKQAVNDGLGKETIEDALEVEAKLFAKSAVTEDAVIGVLSFLSKQQPEFKGK